MPEKSILVTGCSAGGIGEALALALATRGHHVFATARNPAKVPEALSSLSNVTVLQLDVLSTDSAADAARAVSESGRGLDILVNNAGCGYAQPVLDMDIAKAQRLFDTNVWGPIRMIQAFAGLLIASQGRIVNVSSVGAIVNTPWIGKSTDYYLDVFRSVTFAGATNDPR
jgi:NAD(P)-dependent dehydrogenase (short-subunit alcohol dehydrogenase family)